MQYEIFASNFSQTQYIAIIFYMTVYVPPLILCYYIFIYFDCYFLKDTVRLFWLNTPQSIIQKRYDCYIGANGLQMQTHCTLKYCSSEICMDSDKQQFTSHMIKMGNDTVFDG